MEGGSESEETEGRQCWGPARVDWIRQYTGHCSWFPTVHTNAGDLNRQLIEGSSFKQRRATEAGLANWQK